MTRQSEALSDRVVRRVADAADSDALALPPLCDATDPDALEAFVRRTPHGEVSFVYAGYEVTVESDGTVTLDEPLTRGDAAGLTPSDD